MSSNNLRILIVDDTIVYRRILTQIVEEIPNATLVGAVANGKLALVRIKVKPVDLVLLDVEMPVMDGLETLKAIRKTYPDVGVIMVSGTNKNAAAVTIEALDQGALDFVPKPEGSTLEESQKQLAGKIKRLVQLFSTRSVLRGVSDGKPRERRVSPSRKRPGNLERRSSLRVPGQAHSPNIEVTKDEAVTTTRRSQLPSNAMGIVVIGVSTGGPNALAQVIPKFERNFKVPILIVQHMPPLFTKSLAESLNRKSILDVAEAKSGDLLEVGKVLIAPGGKHMVIRKRADGNGYMVGLNENPPENNCRPSVDVLFRSAASHFGKNALALVMTGMGDDGCKGIRVMKRQGTYCLTQDAESCVVYGMPRVIDEAGLSDETVALDRIAERITRIIERAAR